MKTCKYENMQVFKYANVKVCKGAFIYYVITLGGVGGPNTNDDIDDALWGVAIKMMM